MKTFGIARKTASILANLSLFLNTFLPFVIAVQPVYAQNPEEVVPEIVEVSPTPQPSIAVDSSPADPTPENSPTPSSVEPSIIPQPTITPEVTPTPEISPVAEATPTPEPSVEPTPTQFNGELAETTPTPVNSEIGSLTPDVQNTPTPNSQPAESTPEVEQVCLEDNQNIVDSTNDLWTINDVDKISETTQKVQLGTKYIFPSDNKVSVTFKCLPKDEALRTTLKIQQVKTSDLKLPDNMGSLGEYAYDITTGMTDGTFEYDVTLPKTSDSTAEISYIEKSLEQAKLSVSSSEINTIDESKIEQQDNSVKASNIDHFTIFIIVNPDETLVDNSVENQDSGWVSDNNYATFDSNNDYADYGFPNLGIPSGSIIEGIEVYVEGYTSGRDFDISLWNQSNGIDEYTSLKNANLGNSESTITLGGPTDKWGKTWTDADFDTNFKVRVDATSGGNTAYLDMVQVKVYYTEPISVTPPVLPNNPSDTYALTSVTGNWTAISGGSGHQGIGTTEIRWGTPAGVQKSGLRFTNSGAQSFNSGDTFYLGMLTHMNWGTYAGTAANGATLQITLNFNRPNIPNPVFTYDFDIEETSNSAGSCRPYQVSSTPCDDKITFPTSYGTQVVTIGDIQYTLVIDGFVNAYPSGSAVPAFITEEQRENSALLVGHLSSELIPAPAINIEKKTNNTDVTTSPGPELNTGDSVNWQYIVQNIGNVDLTSITVVDDKVGAITCPSSSLPASAIPSERVMTCTASGIVAAGQYTNTATVTAYHTNGTVTDSDSSWYFGINQKGHITVQKTTLPAGDSTVFTTYLTHNTNGTHLATGTISDSTDYTFDVDAGTYKIVEDVPSGWGATSNPCLNGVTVAAGETKYCAIENQKLPVLTVEKVLIGDTAPYSDFSFKVDGGTATPFESDGNNQIYIVPGQAYNLTESDPGSIYNVSYSAGCSGNLTYNQTATCTITNTKYGSLTIIKDANPHSSQSFSFTTSGTGLSNFSLTDDSSDFLSDRKTFNNLLPGTYSVAESSVSGWDLSDVTCTDGSSNTAINLSAGENITCTFTNTMRGAIGGHKYHDTDGNVLTTNDRTLVSNWNITLVNNDTGTSAFTATDQNGSYGFTNLIPGNYTLTEGSRSGWSNSSSQSLTVTLEPGEQDYNNDFINTQFASVLVYKNVDTDGDGDIDETHSTNWKWNLIKDSNSTEYSTGASVSNLYPGSYTISEKQQSGYFVTSLTCNNGVVGADNNYGAVESQAITLSSGQNLVCTFTNTKINPVINVVKSSTTTSITSVGQTVPYTFEVTNAGNQILTGITVTDTKCNTTPVYQSGDTNSDSKLDLSEKWIYSCNHTVTQLEIDNGGNLTNIVTADSNESDPDTDTKNIPITQDPKFTVTKLADVSSVDNAGDVINYTVTVTNTGNQTLTGVSVNDPLLSNLDCNSILSGIQNSNLTINVGDHLTCTGSYIVTQTDIDNYGGGDGDIDNTVTADTNQTDSKTADESVLINGSITIIKTDNLNSGTDFTFNYTIGSSAPTQFVLDDDNGSDNTHLDQTKFSDLSPNSYSIGESSTPGWSSAMVQCTSNYSLDGYQQYTPSLGTISTDLRQGENLICTFSNTRDTGSLTVNKIIDLDGDLTTTDDQTPGANWQFDVDGNSSNTDDPSADYTDINGTKVFSNLRTGLYNIIETKQTGYDLISANCGERNGTFDTIDSVDNASVNKDTNTVCIFYNTPNSTIRGYKWSDLDGDSLHDDGESLLSGWTINLYRALDAGGYESTPFRSTTTSSDSNTFGWYWFEHLLPGNYQICEIPQIGWRQIYPINNGCHLINLPNQSSGSFNADDPELPTYNFSNQQLAVVNVTKFSDLNGNGQQDGGESNLSNWTINLSGQTSVVTNVNGIASFANLIPGSYNLSENLQTGWRQTNIICDGDEGNDNDNSHQITLTAGQTLTCKIANQQLSNLTVYKFNDLNGNGQKDSGEEVLSNWMINLTDQTPLSTNNQGQVTFNNLIPGEYDLSENLSSQPGWHQTNIYCEDQVGGVMITKPGEAYGHHGWCQGWNECQDAATCALWACHARGFSTLVSHGEGKACNSGSINNCHLFNNSEPPILSPNGKYIDNQYVDYNWGTSCGVMGVTDIVCSNGNNSDSNQGSGSYSSGNHLTFTSGNNKICYIGNQRLAPKANISKSNNSGGAELSPGNSVDYTINIDVSDNNINNLKVTDLLSNGFKYKVGSYKVYKNNVDVTSQVGEPQYHSPGLWDLSSLGQLTPEDKIELIYTADISTDQQAGKYADLAYASAVYGYDPDQKLLAAATDEGYIDTNYVGTDVIVNRNHQNSISAGVEKTEVIDGQVLGASTEMPATGAATLWLIISSILGFLGLILIKHDKITKSMAKKIFSIFVLPLFLFLISGQIVFAESSLSVRLEQPKTPSNIKDLHLKFVALDTSGNAITAKCLKKGPIDSDFSQYGSDIILSAGGNASQCDTLSTIDRVGSYQFKVDANGVSSNIVSVDYKDIAPGTPTDYRKENINSNNCDFKIHFKTANDDNKTVKVELYRSTDSAFSVNNESLVHSVNIGSNQEYDITNNVPDCSKTYYYALRAFDNAGNGSGVIGDTITIKTVYSETFITGTPAQGAIPVTGSNIPGESGNGNDQNVSGDNQSETSNQDQSTGQILGSETGFGNFITNHKILSSIIGLGLLAIIIYAFKKIRKGKKSFRRK